MTAVPNLVAGLAQLALSWDRSRPIMAAMLWKIDHGRCEDPSCSDQRIA